jgi:hypothetical protein
MENRFRLDKTAFSVRSFKDADDHVTEWMDKTPWERLEAAFFLINHAYGINSKTKLDRTVFSKRRR